MEREQIIKKAKRVGKISAFVAVIGLAIQEFTPGCSVRLEIPKTDWGIRVGTSAGIKDNLKEPLEPFINTDICKQTEKTTEECAPENVGFQDAFIDIPFPTGSVGDYGILGNFAIGEEPDGVNPVDFDFHITRR